MSCKSSQKRIEANRRNAQKSTGPRTAEGKAKSALNSTTHGLSRLTANPLNRGCFLHQEDESQFQLLLNEYLATYSPQHRDELDLVTEAAYAKWRQQRIWLAETAQIEIAIAQGEPGLRKSLPQADGRAHLANGIAQSADLLRLYLRYDSQLHRHYARCLNLLRDLQAERRQHPDGPNEPNEPSPQPENPAPNEPNPPRPVVPPAVPVAPPSQQNRDREGAEVEIRPPNRALIEN